MEDDKGISKEQIVEHIRRVGSLLGHRPSKTEFIRETGISERRVLACFDTWNEAVEAAGFTPNTTFFPRDRNELLADWGSVARKLSRIPARTQYVRYGKFSPCTLERYLGYWSAVPSAFASFAKGNPEWDDVVALLPLEVPIANHGLPSESANHGQDHPQVIQQHSRLNSRATYGNPTDFRGLRHEPVNEQGVVFLFGMVARELGYMVEAIQSGFPDCEAKRQVAPSKWQRVHIEFEYESRNYRDHGHPIDGCDVIVCWIHNWIDCPNHLEVVELRSVIRLLASSED